MHDTAIPLVYSEPTVLWRMQRPGGLMSYAVIDPRRHRALVVWFVNNRPVGLRDFDDWTAALRWSEQLKAQNWAAGWHAVAE